MENVRITLDAISLYQAQYAQVDTIWGYFSVVTIAMVGFVISTEKATKTLKEPLAIITAYLVFCWGNFEALIAGQNQLRELGEIVSSLSKQAELNITTFQPLSENLITQHYISILLSVCIGVVIIAWIRKRNYDNLSQSESTTPNLKLD